MKNLFRCFALLAFVAGSAQAGPLNWAKHHKRFLAMEGAAIAGASIHAAGLHHCRRVNGVEPCDAHYGAAWASFGFTTGITTIVFPAVAEGCWSNSGGKFCNIFAYTPSTIQAGWGIHEWRIKTNENQKPDLSSVVLLHR
jgi:hypothetical protein